MITNNGKIYCENCGAEVDRYSKNCTQCGKYCSESYYSPRSKTIDLLLCIFLGCFGWHKIYEGKILWFIIYQLTFGLFFIGWISDIYKIATNKATDYKGKQIA